jgi:hypothetical protein
MAGSSQSDPYIESPFDRIVDVHWKTKPLPPTVIYDETSSFSENITVALPPDVPHPFEYPGLPLVGPPGSRMEVTIGPFSGYASRPFFGGDTYAFTCQVTVVDLVTGATLFTAGPFGVFEDIYTGQSFGATTTTLVTPPHAALTLYLQIISADSGDNPVTGDPRAAIGAFGGSLRVVVYS